MITTSQIIIRLAVVAIEIIAISSFSISRSRVNDLLTFPLQPSQVADLNCPEGNGFFVLYYGGSIDPSSQKPTSESISDMRRIWNAQPNFVVVANEFKHSTNVISLFHATDATHKAVRVLSYVMMTAADSTTANDCLKRRPEAEIDSDSRMAMETGYDGMFFDCTRLDTNQYSDIHDWNKARVQEVKKYGHKLIVMNPGEALVDSRVFDYADIVSVENRFDQKPTAYLPESGKSPEKSNVVPIDPWRWLAVQGDPAKAAAKDAKDALKRLKTFRKNGGYWYYSSARGKDKPTHVNLPDWLEDLGKEASALAPPECKANPTLPIPSQTLENKKAGINKFELWQPPVRLRGANTWQRLRDHVVTPVYSCEDIHRLSSLGANYVNISHPGILSEKPKHGQYVLEQAAVQNLIELVRCATQQNMFIVVAYRTGPERKEEIFDGHHRPSNVFTNELAQAAWVEMWARTAQILHDYPFVVGYDLMVEPDTGRHVEQWNDLAKRIIRAIRERDPDTPILIEAADGGDLESLLKVKVRDFDPAGNQRLIFALHQYEPSDYSQQTEGKWEYDCNTLKDKKGSPQSSDFQFYSMERKQALRTAYSILSQWREEQHAVVAVNEFGVVRWAGGSSAGRQEPDGDQFIGDQLGFLESLDISHAIWKWDPIECQGDDDYDFLHGQIFSSHADVSSELRRKILDNWQKNVVRPGQTLIPTSSRLY